MNTSLRTLSVNDLLDRFASADPTPGGGSAAALSGALAASLVSMVCRLTIGRERFASVQAEAQRLLEMSEQLRADLEHGIDADAQAYDQVAGAFRMPRATDEDKAARSRAIEQATRAAAQPPMEIARACGQVLDAAEAGVPILNPSAISDLEVAAHLALAGLYSALANVEINVRGLRDPTEVAEIRAAMQALSAGRDAQAQRAIEQARARLP